jgi:GalNAc-alpha-(1->4)-GalNAc-alpha-(1->3)-diNAcBac-PP-undecaprenol alpha-1,4-N-acetyl-D-galactosaminyltransferase
MKVLLLIDSLNSGGAQRQLAMLANYLKVNQKCEVEIVTYVDGNHYADITTDIGVKITCIRKRSKFDLALLIGLIRHVRKQQIDTLCSFLYAPSLYALLVKLCSFRKLKVVVSERTYERTLDIISKSTRMLYRFADVITANSQSQVDILKLKYPNFKSKIICIQNGVDINKFAPNIYFQYKEFSVAAIGRIEELKNPLCLIEAMQLLKTKHNISLTVHWAGNLSNSEATTAYYNLCNTKLEQYKLTQNWNWLGVVKDIPQLINSAEMVVHPSLGEGFPNTICEALSSGSIVFASNILDHPFVINEGENGFLFNPHDSTDLALKIKHYLDLTNNKKLEIREKARDSAIKTFSFEKMAESYLKLFQNS